MQSLYSSRNTHLIGHVILGVEVVHCLCEELGWRHGNRADNLQDVAMNMSMPRQCTQAMYLLSDTPMLATQKVVVVEIEGERTHPKRKHAQKDDRDLHCNCRCPAGNRCNGTLWAQNTSSPLRKPRKPSCPKPYNEVLSWKASCPAHANSLFVFRTAKLTAPPCRRPSTPS